MPNTGLLGSATATERDRRDALIISALLLVAFAATAPFANMPLVAIPAFVPSYDAAVFILDLITAVLLYTQYRELKHRSLLALTCAYAFTPPLIAVHALTFPDAFGPGSLIGGDQSTAWLWVVWHGLFPFFVATYALLAWRERNRGIVHAQSQSGRSGIIALTATLMLSGALIWLTTIGEPHLPVLMLGSQYQSLTTKWILTTGWSTHLIALGLVLWFTRARRLIDVWVAVILVAALIDLALSAILVDARYQLGFYVGRFYGLLAASFMLILLLQEISRLQANAVQAWNALQTSEEQFRRSIEDAPIPVIMLAEDGQVLQFSKAWVEAIDGGPVGQLLSVFKTSSSQAGLETDVVTRTGETRCWRFSVSLPGTLSDGRRFIVAMALDITEQKQSEAKLRRDRLAALNIMEDAMFAQQALRESEERFRALVEGFSQAIWETDGDGRVVTDSPSWRAYTGQTVEEWMGEGWVNAIHPDDRDYALRQWKEAVKTRGLVNAEFRLRCARGGWRWTNVRAAPLYDADGTVRKWVGMNVDIDKLRRGVVEVQEERESV